VPIRASCSGPSLARSRWTWTSTVRNVGYRFVPVKGERAERGGEDRAWSASAALAPARDSATRAAASAR